MASDGIESTLAHGLKPPRFLKFSNRLVVVEVR